MYNKGLSKLHQAVRDGCPFEHASEILKVSPNEGQFTGFTVRMANEDDIHFDINAPWVSCSHYAEYYELD
ncbi:hypothetical protein BH11PSE5_BH11PSE5_03470 [soil metagenome]